MKTTLVVGALLLALLAIHACRAGHQEAPTSWRVGGVYSIDSGEGDFRVAKILALDPGVIGVRIYKQKFATRPTTVEPSSLTLGSIHDRDGFGMGHLPIDEREFAAWKPQLLLVQDVTGEELDGYREWKSQSGH